MLNCIANDTTPLLLDFSPIGPFESKSGGNCDFREIYNVRKIFKYLQKMKISLKYMTILNAYGILSKLDPDCFNLVHFSKIHSRKCKQIHQFLRVFEKLMKSCAKLALVDLILYIQKNIPKSIVICTNDHSKIV